MKRTSNEEYFDLYREWTGSGVSMASFAAGHGLSKSGFYYWAKKFGQEQSIPDVSPGFSLMPHQSGNVPIPTARINYPSGISLELFGSMDTEKIRSLVR